MSEVGDVIEVDGLLFEVAEKQAVLSRYKKGRDTVVEGYTLGLRSCDNPRLVVEKATELDHLRIAFPSLFKLLYKGALTVERVDIAGKLIDEALADLKKLL